MKWFSVAVVLLALGTIGMSGCASRRTTPVPTPSPTALPTATRPPVVTISAPAATATPLPPTVTPIPPTATQPPTATPTAIQISAAELPVLKAGVLKSYVAQMEVLEASSATQHEPVSRLKMEIRYQGEPEPGAYAVTMVGTMPAFAQTGNQTGSGETKMVVTGGDTYIYLAERQQWVKLLAGGNSGVTLLGQNVIDQDRIAQDVAGGLITVENVAGVHEVVDGVDTTHFRAEGKQIETLLANAGVANRTAVSGQADFWVCNEAGYLKKYVLQATFEDQDGQTIQQTMDMLVTGENQPVQVTPPPADQVVDMSSMMRGIATASASGTATPAP